MCGIPDSTKQQRWWLWWCKQKIKVMIVGLKYCTRSRLCTALLHVIIVWQEADPMFRWRVLHSERLGRWTLFLDRQQSHCRRSMKVSEIRPLTVPITASKHRFYSQLFIRVWIHTHRIGPRHVGSSGRLVISRPIKPMFFRYLSNVVFPIYSSVLAPIIGWRLRELPGWLTP